MVQAGWRRSGQLVDGEVRELAAAMRPYLCSRPVLGGTCGLVYQMVARGAVHGLPPEQMVEFVVELLSELVFLEFAVELILELIFCGGEKNFLWQ